MEGLAGGSRMTADAHTGLGEMGFTAEDVESRQEALQANNLALGTAHEPEAGERGVDRSGLSLQG